MQKQNEWYSNSVKQFSCWDSILSVRENFLWWFVKKQRLRQINCEHENMKKLFRESRTAAKQLHTLFMFHSCFVFVLRIVSSGSTARHTLFANNGKTLMKQQNLCKMWIVCRE